MNNKLVDYIQLGGYWGISVTLLSIQLYASNMKPLFSERYGYTKSCRLFGIKLSVKRLSIIGGAK